MLLGREKEVAAALDVCRGAEAGHGSALVVAGDPGIGKTALLDAERSFARLELVGLERAEARRLLDASTPTALTPAVADRLLDVCAGSPLGLIEIPVLLTDAQRRGEEPLPTAFEAGPLVK